MSNEQKPRHEPVVLYYTGDAAGEQYIPGVPARDLTRPDVARVAYVETIRTGKRVTATAVADQLAASPLYRRTNPAAATKSTRRSIAPAPRPPAPEADAAGKES